MKKTFCCGLLFLMLSIAMIAQASPKIKEWTFAVYMNADNLSEVYDFAGKDLAEMAKTGSNDFLNVVALVDYGYNAETTGIHYVEKNKVTRVKKISSIDMANPVQFLRFVSYVKKQYPAKHYAIVFWHRNIVKNIYKGIFHDGCSENFMNIHSLKETFKKAKEILGQQIDVLGFDVSYMQMLGVAYECKDSAKYLVGLQAKKINDSVAYDKILDSLKPNTRVKTFAKNWAKEYVKKYKKSETSFAKNVTCSALDLQKINDLVKALEHFVTIVLSGKYEKTFNYSYGEARHFTMPASVDLWHLIKIIKKRAIVHETPTSFAKLSKACDVVAKALSNFIIFSDNEGYRTTSSVSVAGQRAGFGRLGVCGVVGSGGAGADRFDR